MEYCRDVTDSSFLDSTIGGVSPLDGFVRMGCTRAFRKFKEVAWVIPSRFQQRQRRPTLSQGI